MDVGNAALSTITNQVKEGLNGGNWSGPGGITLSPDGYPISLYALGVIQNNQSGSALFTSTLQFDGTTPSAGDVLIKYTYYGDANLSGAVDGSDYSLIDSAYVADRTSPTAMTGWFNGDFNYDGFINGSDYTLMDNAFNSQGAILNDIIAGPDAAMTAQLGAASSVPEPSLPVIIGLASLGLLGRRTRFCFFAR
jgi:hypothetical protein